MITVIFDGQKKVIVSGVRGARVVGSDLPASSVNRELTFELDRKPEKGTPPNSFSFDASVRQGYIFDVSLPTQFVCNFSLSRFRPSALSPPPPRPMPPPTVTPPSPQPPPPPPPANKCALGLAWKVEVSWPGGLRAAVLVVVWQPGAVVQLDFRSSFPQGTTKGNAPFAVTSAHHSRIGSCEVNSGEGTTCEFVLGGAPDEKHGFGFVIRGSGDKVRPPSFSCAAVGEELPSDYSSPSAAPPAPLPPLLEPASFSDLKSFNDGDCLMKARLSVKTSWQAGYRAAVSIAHWLPDAVISIEFAPDYHLKVLATYGARLQSVPDEAGAASFRLASAPDPEYDGFGFTARGIAPPLSSLRVTCKEVTPDMLVSPPPATDCPFGAEFKYLEQWSGGFEAEVHVRSWRAGARICLDFSAVTSAPLQLLNSWHASSDNGAEAAESATDMTGHAVSGSALFFRLVEVDPSNGQQPKDVFRLTVRLGSTNTNTITPSLSAAPHITCAVVYVPPPPPSPSPPSQTANTLTNEQNQAWRPPHKPEAPVLLHASCASVSLRWTAPDAYGWSIDGYRVWATRDGLPATLEEDGLRTTQAELTGLLPGAEYEFRVQARGPAGISEMSEPTKVSTEKARHKPEAPFEPPKPLKSTRLGSVALGDVALRKGVTSLDLKENDAGAADVDHKHDRCPESPFLLELPSLRGGCSGDRWFSIEWRDASRAATWHIDSGKHVSSTVSVPSLRPESLHAHQVRYFRLVAHNDAGSSEGGPLSEPILPFHDLSAAVQPPLVYPTGSASVRLSPSHGRESSCGIDKGFRFEILMRREGSLEWKTLTQIGPQGTNISADKGIELGGIRCPLGCYFQLHALNISGWTSYSQPSIRIRTPLAPAAPEGVSSARLQLKLKKPLSLETSHIATAQLQLEDTGQHAATTFLQEVAHAVHLPEEKLSVAEISFGGAFVQLDLLTSDSSSMQISHSVKHFVQYADALEDLPTFPIDRGFGILCFTEEPEDGETQLLPTTKKNESSSTEHEALRITTFLICITMVLACCSPVIRTIVYHFQTKHHTHSRLSTSELDDCESFQT